VDKRPDNQALWRVDRIAVAARYTSAGIGARKRLPDEEMMVTGDFLMGSKGPKAGMGEGGVE